MLLVCGASDTPVFGHLVTSALGFTSRVDPSFLCFLASVILRFITGAAPADLLAVSIAVKPFVKHPVLA